LYGVSLCQNAEGTISQHAANNFLLLSTLCATDSLNFHACIYSLHTVLFLFISLQCFDAVDWAKVE